MGVTRGYLHVMPSRAALYGGVAAAAVWCGPGLAVHWPPVARALGVPLRARSGGVALTFDDGPHPEGTPAVLAAHQEARARATFFLVGEQVERHRSLAAEIAAAGHEVAVHGFRHRNQMRLTPLSFAEDLKRALATIAEVCGRPPRLYRPPYGVFTPAGLATVRRASLQPLLWSRWGRDWRDDMSPEAIARLAAGELVAGDVILLHDADWYSHAGAHHNTAAAVPLILAEMAARDLPAVVPQWFPP
jgi:peptidoglycan/xylan/chitin deacetylase (PgdA/CDA1 family)